MTPLSLCVEILTGLWLSAGTLWALAAVRLWFNRVRVTQKAPKARRAGWRAFSAGMLITAIAVVGFLAPSHVMVYNDLTTHLHSFIMEGLGILMLNLAAILMLTALDRILERGMLGAVFYVITSIVSALLGAALAAL